MERKFKSGQIVTTAGVFDRMSGDPAFGQFVTKSLERHLSGDWGDLDAEDRATNDAGVEGGDRLLSAYATPDFPKIWIITEWDRSVTTVLFPSEY